MPDRIPEDVYAGKKQDKMLFKSRLKPQIPQYLGPRKRHIMIMAKRDTGPPAPAYNKDEQVYAEPAGVIHLDRCWNEQGKERVSCCVLSL